MPKGCVTVSERPTRATPRSPFEGQPASAQPNAAGTVGVCLHAEVLASVTQVSTWITGVDVLETALAAACGQPLPARTGDTRQTVLGLCIRTGPEEFLLVSDQAADNTALLRRHIAADVGSVTDLSHARCRIRIAGDRSRDALSKLFAIDLREAAFPVGLVELTGHHHVPALLHRVGPDRFDIYVFTTYARDQLLTLADAALEFGVSVAP